MAEIPDVSHPHGEFQRLEHRLYPFEDGQYLRVEVFGLEPAVAFQQYFIKGITFGAVKG